MVFLALQSSLTYLVYSVYGLEVSKTYKLCFCIRINLVLLSLLSGIKVTLCYGVLKDGLLHVLDVCLAVQEKDFL